MCIELSAKRLYIKELERDYDTLNQNYKALTGTNKKEMWRNEFNDYVINGLKAEREKLRE